MKTVKPIDPRNQEWIETMRNTPRTHPGSNELAFHYPIYGGIRDPAMDHYKSKQAFEIDLIMDAALDKAIEENDIQYIIKHKERQIAERQVDALDNLSSLASTLYEISLNYERNSE
jgi:hypothetical protein